MIFVGDAYKSDLRDILERSQNVKEKKKICFILNIFRCLRLGSSKDPKFKPLHDDGIIQSFDEMNLSVSTVIGVDEMNVSLSTTIGIEEDDNTSVIDEDSECFEFYE
uniref:DUF659 domain-containing protein n=1 Tax=Rhabditophanes sp. KR3021 TaxID=114890 RepID=A0AC35UCZ2_9BILA